MQREIRIMNITNGDEVNGYWETLEEAKNWRDSQDVPEWFQIMNENSQNPNPLSCPIRERQLVSGGVQTIQVECLAITHIASPKANYQVIK